MKGIIKFLKGVIVFILVLIIMLGLIYVTCKYIIKDTKLIDNIKRYILGNQNEVFVELKDENFKNEVERAKYFYYMQLDDNAKVIYIVLENNIDNFKNGKENIKLPDSLNKLLESDGGQQKAQQAFQDAWDAFSKDKPELFYLDGNKFYLVINTVKTFNKTDYELLIGKGKNETYFSDGFKTINQVNTAIEKMDESKKKLKSKIETKNEEYTYSYEKVLTIHDWIIDNVEYDEELKEHNNGNAYGALCDNIAVCEGYAEAFKYMMDALEVPCITVCGIGKNSDGKEEKHAWNYVYIANKWYAVDTTWDDPIINSNSDVSRLNSKVKYKYFLKGSNTINKDHVITGQIVDNGKIFAYPDLDTEDFKK